MSVWIKKEQLKSALPYRDRALFCVLKLLCNHSKSAGYGLLSECL